MRLDAATDADGVARAWAESGLQAITHSRAALPTRLVVGANALIDRLGGALTDEFAAGGLGVLSERWASLMLRRSGRTSCNGVSRLVRSGDGWLAITLARSDDRKLLPAWLGIEIDHRRDQTPWAEIERRVVERSSADLIEVSGLLGLPCSVVGEVANRELVKSELLGERGASSIQGLRVVNLGSLWAAPLCADLLRRAGADVVNVESTARPDGARATPGWFDAIHAGQRSVALDFRSPEGAATLRRLLAAADVVIEGSRPRALAQLGIDARSMVDDSRVSVWASITAYGRDPDLAMRVGLGDDAAAAGGLVGWVDEAPVFVGDAIADPLTGVVAAMAVIDQITSGGRALLDISLARTAATFATRPGDPLVASSADAEAVDPRPRERASRRFELGADTAGVLDEWLKGD